MNLFQKLLFPLSFRVKKIKTFFCFVASLGIINSSLNAQVGSAIDFDGLNDYITMPLITTATNNVTVEFKICRSCSCLLGVFDGVVFYNGTMGVNGFGLYIHNGSKQLYWTYGGVASGAIGMLPLNGWVSIAMVITTNNLKVYKDGQLWYSTNPVGNPLTPTGISSVDGNHLGTQNSNDRLDELRVWNVARTQCEINTYINCEIPASAPGLLANYHFNSGIAGGNNTGVTTLIDASGNNLHGTLFNFALSGPNSNWISPGAVANNYTTAIPLSVTPSIVATTTAALCAPNAVTLTAISNPGALDFDGTTGFVTIPHHTNQVPANEMTIEGWIYAENTGSTTPNTILMKGNNGYGLSLGANGCTGGAKLNYWTGATCASVITSTASVPYNKWTHIAVVAKLTPSPSVQFFIDGLAAGTFTTGVTINSGGNGPLILGKEGTGCACNYFKGKMDELRIWSVARTQLQIAQKMNAGFVSIPPGLELYLKMDNFVGGVINDLSSNNTSATLSGGTVLQAPSLAPVLLEGSSYTWSPGGANPALVVMSTGIYSVSAGFNNGCPSGMATQSVTINPQPFISSNNGLICQGNSFTISPAGASTYTISGGASVVSPSVGTFYFVTGTSSLGCVSSNTAATYVAVDSPSIYATSGAICSGDTFTIAPSGANTYTINGGSFVVSPTVNTTYSITGTSVNGCPATNVGISSVTVNPLPIVSANSGTICTGNSFTIIPNGASTYTITGGSSVVSPTANSFYYTVGTDTNGCVSFNNAISYIVVNPLPDIDATTEYAILCAGQIATLSASGALNYVWGNGDTTSFIIISPTVSSTYTLSGTDANGCTNVITVFQEVSLCEGLQTQVFAGKPYVYPNPGNGLFIVELESGSVITVSDVLGKVIYKERLENGKHTVNLSDFNPGIYILMAECNGVSTTTRLVKE